MRSSRVDGRPAMQFYLMDWITDTRILSVADRGIWIDTLAWMHRSPRRGYLLMPNGCSPDAQAMQRFYGTEPGEAEAALERIVGCGVGERDDSGVIYNRRMVREAEVQNRRSAHGKRAAEARWDAQRMLNDGSSSSSSSSTSSSIGESVPPNPAGLALAKKLQAGLRTRFPNLPTSKLGGQRLDDLLTCWATEFDRIGRIDGTVDRLDAIVTWAVADDFWSRNAQSPKAFRTRKAGTNAPIWVQFETRKTPADSRTAELTRRALECNRKAECNGSGKGEACAYCPRTKQGSKR